jgi:hypothetical protein
MVLGSASNQVSLIMTRPFSVLAVALALVAVGCAKNEACTKTRLEASDSWKEVHEKAGKWKLQGAVGYEEYDERQKAEHYKIWNSIETNAEMIWKGFAFEKITWTTSDPARDKAMKEFKGYWAADKYSSFQSLLEGANKRYDDVAAKCK